MYLLIYLNPFFPFYLMSDVRTIDASYKIIKTKGKKKEKIIKEKKINFNSIVTMTTYEEQDIAF